MRADMIYTSYFGNIKKIQNAISDAMFISIAGKTPEWFTGKKYIPLMPHYDWWNEWHIKFENDLECQRSKDWYISKYNDTVLKMLNPNDVARDLKDLAEWKPTFILCYETPEKFCHRHIVADWLTKTGYSIQCKEWTDEDT